jgi:hypothetical protein
MIPLVVDEAKATTDLEKSNEIAGSPVEENQNLSYEEPNNEELELDS